MERYSNRGKRQFMGFHVKAENGYSFQRQITGYTYPHYGEISGISGTGKDDTVFNVLSHRRISNALKVIAKHCNITTNVSFHVARHCFASQLCLSQGVPIESVSRMMGHRNIQTTQRYARVNNEKIGNDMKQLSQRLAGKFNLAVNN